MKTYARPGSNHDASRSLSNVWGSWRCTHGSCFAGMVCSDSAKRRLGLPAALRDPGSRIHALLPGSKKARQSISLSMSKRPRSWKPGSSSAQRAKLEQETSKEGRVPANAPTPSLVYVKKSLSHGGIIGACHISLESTDN